MGLLSQAVSVSFFHDFHGLVFLASTIFWQSLSYSYSLVCFSSQVFLAGLARQSMARMGTEDPQGLQERLGDLAGQAQWGYQVSVSLPHAWELQPIPLLASQSLGPSRGHEQPARTEPISV